MSFNCGGTVTLPEIAASRRANAKASEARECARPDSLANVGGAARLDIARTNAGCVSITRKRKTP